jgi:hypothetical protein
MGAGVKPAETKLHAELEAAKSARAAYLEKVNAAILRAEQALTDAQREVNRLVDVKTRWEKSSLNETSKELSEIAQREAAHREAGRWMEGDPVLDLIAYGHQHRVGSAPLSRVNFSLLISVVIEATPQTLDVVEMSTARRHVAALVNHLPIKPHMLFPWGWPTPWTARNLVVGAEAALVEALLATAAKYHSELREYHAGLASVLKADFIRGTRWACAGWNYQADLNGPYI